MPISTIVYFGEKVGSTPLKIEEHCALLQYHCIVYLAKSRKYIPLKAKTSYSLFLTSSVLTSTIINYIWLIFWPHFNFKLEKRPQTHGWHLARFVLVCMLLHLTSFWPPFMFEKNAFFILSQDLFSSARVTLASRMQHSTIVTFWLASRSHFQPEIVFVII